IHKEFLFNMVKDLPLFRQGGARDYLTQKDFLEIQIPLPPIEVQREIVAEIEGYQKIIDGARQVVDHWKPDVQGYLDEELKNFHTESTEHTEKGKPSVNSVSSVRPDSSGWPMVKLGDVIIDKPKNGYSGKPVDYATQWKVLSLSATTQGYLKKEFFKYLDESFDDNFYAVCRKGDIYLQRGNTSELVGMPAIFDIDEKGYIFPDLMIRIVADNAKINTYYLHRYLLSKQGREYLTSNATGAAGNMPKINQSIVESMPIPLPPIEVQERIVAKIEAERKSVDGCRDLMKTYEEKIKRVIDSVWEG
ncbi:MAG TPA: restriction endonuclease subunit S, partial [Leptospiraceae bacterium]|nr:restriction endonuclease subunit S [Leptospiraceae bacterium]